MARGLFRLTVKEVSALKKEGRYCDGGGLYLCVREGGSRQWEFRFRWGGVRKVIGFGGLPDVSLATARDAAAVARGQIKSGIDPQEARRANKVRVETDVPTFGVLADEYLESVVSSFKNAAHRANWMRSLKVQAKPIRNKRVDQIDLDDVIATLKPYWISRPETGRKLRGRIEKIFDVARVRKHRTTENPAAWTGHLELMLPVQDKTKKHHKAVPWQAIPEFMAKLRKRYGVGAACLEYTILTAARTQESLFAEPGEVSADGVVWKVPETRMKRHVEHSVPLSRDALQVWKQNARADQKFVFRSQDGVSAMSENSMLAVLRDMNVDATVHGFRSSFRDWAGEATDYPRELAEMALSHVVGNEVELAYRRGQAVERRRQLMEDWAAYCRSWDGVSSSLPGVTVPGKRVAGDLARDDRVLAVGE